MFNVDISSDLVFLIRMLMASVCGAIVGLEREKRQKSAGLRTHIIVCMASSLMMIVSKYGFMDVVAIEGIGVDASRIASSVVSAIGFLGAGVIYIKKDNQVGLTTAAGLWATVGIGVALGSGLYFIGIAATCLVIFVQLVMHSKKLKVVTSAGGTITVNLTKHNLTLSKLRENLEREGMFFRNMTVTRNDRGELMLKASVMLSKRESLTSFVDDMKRLEYIDSIEIYTLN